MCRGMKTIPSEKRLIPGRSDMRGMKTIPSENSLIPGRSDVRGKKTIRLNEKDKEKCL